MGGDRNTIELVTAQGIEPWPPQSKEDVAAMLIARIAQELEKNERKFSYLGHSGTPRGGGTGIQVQIPCKLLDSDFACYARTPH